MGVKYMDDKNLKKELTGLSADFVQLFVGDILTRNNVGAAPENTVSPEQREQLKQTILDLQAKVDEMMERAAASKDAMSSQKVSQEAPLRALMRKKRENNS